MSAVRMSIVALYKAHPIRSNQYNLTELGEFQFIRTFERTFNCTESNYYLFNSLNSLQTNTMTPQVFRQTSSINYW